MYQEVIMNTKAKVFMTGRSQAVRLPIAFRFDTPEVFIHRNANGDVVLSKKPKPKSWATIFAALDKAGVPEDFLSDRNQQLPEERTAL
jgi:antitoxin VapB